MHLALLGAAALTLPLSIAQGWGEPPATGTAFWLLGLFTVSIGLPFFALAANNPLLQSWFVAHRPSRGQGPLFSLCRFQYRQLPRAVVLSDLCWSPRLRCRRKTGCGAAALSLLIALIAGCGALLLRSPAGAVTAHEADGRGAQSRAG